MAIILDGLDRFAHVVINEVEGTAKMILLPMKATIHSNGNFSYFSFNPGLASLSAIMFFCNGTGTIIPPCANRSVRASFSGSPAVQILEIGKVGLGVCSLISSFDCVENSSELANKETT